MGFTEVLTIIFIVLKLLGVIDWNWFLVLLPEIIACLVYILALMMIGKQELDIKKFWKDEK